jgi:hypothetical protein
MFQALHHTESKQGRGPLSSHHPQPAFFQPKLTVNQPGDQYEQEADRVADQVMRMREGDAPIVQRMPLTPVGNVQRKCADCEKEEAQRKETDEKEEQETPVQRMRMAGSSGAAARPDEEEKVQRKCAACEDKEKEQVQRKENTSGDASGQTAPSIVSDVLSSGGGQPMDGGTRQFMESRFGQDFGQVRIHTGSRAAESAGAIQARAYTSGNNIVFGNGAYQPSSEEGRLLLAHELVHVGQQGGASLKRYLSIPTQSKKFPADIDLLFNSTSENGKGIIQRKTTGSQQYCPATCPPGSAPAYRPVSDPGFNCYAYAMNSPSSGFLQPGQRAQTQEFKVAQKGDTLGISRLSAIERIIYLNYHSPAGVIRNSEADLGSRFTNNCDNCCAPGKRKIVAVTTNSLASLRAGMSWDHHWYRKDSDGAWSHKRGQTPSTRQDASGTTPLCNPCTASRNYGNLDYSNVVGSWCL